MLWDWQYELRYLNRANSCCQTRTLFSQLDYHLTLAWVFLNGVFTWIVLMHISSLWANQSSQFHLPNSGISYILLTICQDHLLILTSKCVLVRLGSRSTCQWHLSTVTTCMLVFILIGQFVLLSRNIMLESKFQIWQLLPSMNGPAQDGGRCQLGCAKLQQ